MFHWKKRKSLILHEVAKTAGLESCGRKSIVDTIYMGEVESSCAYWFPLRTRRGRDRLSQGERSIDYIANYLALKIQWNGVVSFLS
jgi:hypothetical protein